MPYHYTTGVQALDGARLVFIAVAPRLAQFVNTFQFCRLRLHFEALGPLAFPPGGSANVVRGALGEWLPGMGPDAARLFRPAPAGPSGLKLAPRPFVLRTRTLDGRDIMPGELFSFDLHVCDCRAPVLDCFRGAFEMVAAEGLGPGRARVRLMGVDTLDLAGNPAPAGFRCVVPLEPEVETVNAVTLLFLTPTELKAEGHVVDEPEFRHLFARLRDRIAMLSALYGAGPLKIDFRALGERSAAVRLERSSLTWEYANRRSTRTGQIHPLGGFTGTVEYRGPLAEFLPWLRAAQWVGVGRQTVWGKGELQVASVETGA